MNKHMLRNFFTLNMADATAISRFEDKESFVSYIENRKNLSDFMYIPDILGDIKIENKIFYNCSFKNTTFNRISFKKCIFIDCIFMGVFFVNCVITDCTFFCTNTNGIKFCRTFVRPDTFKYATPMESIILLIKRIILKRTNDNNYANIGVKLYQSLLDGYKMRSQIIFSPEAEYYFRKWSMYHFIYKNLNKINKMSRLKLIPHILWYAVGFGIKVKSFLITSMIVFISFVFINYSIWGYFGIHSNVDTFYCILQYTFYTCFSIGATPHAATGVCGIIISIAEGIIGWLLLGIGISMIAKKIIG